MTPIETKTREKIFKQAEDYLSGNNLKISSRDTERPWGGFLVADDKETERFIDTFFPEYSATNGTATKKQGLLAGRLSPKILIVAPHKRLSWQYHHRRSEIWTLLEGEAGIITGNTDEENDMVILEQGKTTEIRQGERHRLIGLNDWGIVAEIWRHTDPDHPSDENDIVRVQDDFGRGRL